MEENKLILLERSIRRAKANGETITGIEFDTQVFHEEIYPLLAAMGSRAARSYDGNRIFDIPFQLSKFQWDAMELKSIRPDWIISIKT